MQLSLNDSANTADEDLETLELLLTPTATYAPPQIAGTASVGNTEAETIPASTALYNALSACAELHPDPDPSDDEGDGLMGDVPGAGGWITSENMDQFMDEEGNLRIHENGDADGMIVLNGGDAGAGNRLGAGAGTRRGPEDGDTDEGADGEETKWRRTG